jgi:hypothetical protein
VASCPKVAEVVVVKVPNVISWIVPSVPVTAAVGLIVKPNPFALNPRLIF